MLQSLATLVFASAALLAAGLIAALIAGDWEAVLRSLGLARILPPAPAPRRVRVLATCRVPVLRVIPGELRRAA